MTIPVGLVRLWNGIANIGLDETTPAYDRKRVRLLNIMCLISGLAYLGNAIYLFQHPISFLECLLALSVNMLIISVNSLKKYALACHLFSIWNIFIYSLMGIIQGANDATELYLIPSSVLSMFFFDRLHINVIYFLINGCCYGLTVFLQNNYPPINVFEGQNQLYLSNHALMFAVLFAMIYSFKSENLFQEKLLEERNRNLDYEKQRSDRLLLNILPAKTAEELKATGQSKAQEFKLVTVLFTDFQDFTTKSALLTPDQIVREMNSYYVEFDKIMSRHGVEKIKTIGDGYMAAGGLPIENTTNPLDVTNAALEVLEMVAAEKTKRIAEGRTFFELRVGIHSGPVVAGIIGINKFSYDIWGDTVNTAARMQSSGEVGKVNVSGSTYALIKDRYKTTHRGKIQAKGKGEIDMYFVERP